MSDGYGQHYESMYSGSMVGSGALAFALMGYVIAKTRPRTHTVELNPVLLATILGEPIDCIVQTIERLCSPDPQSRTKKEDGRRLIRRGEFEYFVVNHEHYRGLAAKERRRKYQADLMAKRRASDSLDANNVLTCANSPASASASASVQDRGVGKGLSLASWEQAKRWLSDCRSNGADYTERECRFAWLAFEANGWRWGKNPITDWRSALERQIQTDRNNSRERPKKSNQVAV